MPSLNLSNCWKPLRAYSATTWPARASVNAKNEQDWAISSQVAWKQVKGSTTRNTNRSINVPVKFPRTGGACEIVNTAKPQVKI